MKTDFCLTCSGLIPEPNKAYGYAGKVCYCVEEPRIRRRASEQHQSLMGIVDTHDRLFKAEHIGTEDAQFLRDMNKTPTGPVTVLPWRCSSCEVMVAQDENHVCVVHELREQVAAYKEALEFIPDLIFQLEHNPDISDITQFTNEFYELNKLVRMGRVL